MLKIKDSVDLKELEKFGFELTDKDKYYSIIYTYYPLGDSQKDVERELGFRQNCISNCALGRCKSSYGYVWRLNYE